MNQKPGRKNFVDFSIWYHLIHSYVQTVFKKENLEKQNKQMQLQQMGQKLGRNLIEVISSEDSLDKFKKDKNVPYVEYIKYLCKDFWSIFNKNIPKVQHNSKGTFYITDTDFALLNRISYPNECDKKDVFDLWSSFLAGLIEGALHSFDINSEVETTIINPVQTQNNSFDPFKTEVTFQIHIEQIPQN